jgi:soluble lytic murein transglycosylase-like protein
MKNRLIFAATFCIALTTSPWAFASFDGSDNWIDLDTAQTQAKADTSGAQPDQSHTSDEGTHNLRALVERHARENGIPFAIADAVVKIESNYNPRANHAGNMGLMQIRPQTARGEGFKGQANDLLNPDTNLHFAMRYLGDAYRLSGGDVCATLMRYQSGHGTTHMSASNRRYCARARHFMARG